MKTHKTLKGGNWRTYSLKNDFEAIGNGSADDTAKIQDAIDSICADGGGRLFVEPGKYNYTEVEIPSVGPTNGIIPLEIVGAFAPSNTFGTIIVEAPISNKGSIFNCTSNTGGFRVAYGGGYANFSAVKVILGYNRDTCKLHSSVIRVKHKSCFYNENVY